jgi:hypothetical protein
VFGRPERIGKARPDTPKSPRNCVTPKLTEYSMNKLVIFGFIFALLILVACVPFGKPPKQNAVRILDAETRAPIPSAQIDLHYYPSTPDAPEPDHPRAIANTQGVATLSNKDKMAIWQVRADGYIEQRLSSNNGAPPPRYAANATGDYDGVIYLYKLPEPQLNIVVNDNYTGPLTIQLEPAAGFDWIKVDKINVAFAAVDPQASYIQKSAGTRVFTETASTAGVVDLVVTPLLYDIQTQQLLVHDRSSALPFRDIANPQDFERGVWGTVTDDEKRIYHQVRLFVGTREDYLKFLKTGQ